MQQYDKSLNQLLETAGIDKKTAYTTGNVAKILSVAVGTVVYLCDLWTPEKKNGLECYVVGTHRRIPHHSLIEWLGKNTYYEKLGE